MMSSHLPTINYHKSPLFFSIMSEHTESLNPTDQVPNQNQEPVLVKENANEEAEQVYEEGNAVHTLNFSLNNPNEIYEEILIEDHEINDAPIQQQSNLNLPQSQPEISLTPQIATQTPQNYPETTAIIAQSLNNIQSEVQPQYQSAQNLNDSNHKPTQIVNQYHHPLSEILNIQEQDKTNELVERYDTDPHTAQYENQQLYHQDHPINSEHHPQTIPQSTSEPVPDHYNSYIQAVLNSPHSIIAEPTQDALAQIYAQLEILFPQFHPKQIIMLLHNNLIKAPMQALCQAQSKQFDPSIKYDGGHKYLTEINTSPSTAAKYDLSNFQFRKHMIYVYVTKGYGVKVFQEYMNTVKKDTTQIDKAKFKKHFMDIYKITLKKVQEFLTTTADRQFEPLTKDQYIKPMSDVINCKKHYSKEFCQIFYRILQATFDISFPNVPNQEQTIFFYRTIMEKLRGSKVKIVRKLHQHKEQKDTDIWTEEFETMVIKSYIMTKNLAQTKAKIFQNNPEYEGFISNQDIASKIENAIRIAVRWLAIANTECGNPVPFEPSDIDRKFIMTAKELEESRVKLLKVYVKKPRDPQVLGNIVNFIHEQLKGKYEIERVPEEVRERARARQLPRPVEKSGLETLLKSQMIRNYN